MTESFDYSSKFVSKDLLKEAKEALREGKEMFEIYMDSLQDNELNSLIYDRLSKADLDEEELQIKYYIEGIFALKANIGRNK